VWIVSRGGYASQPDRQIRIALTEKEKELLKQLARSPRPRLRMPRSRHAAHYRLACQCFVRNEDILVTFEGDQTLPPQGPISRTPPAV